MMLSLSDLVPLEKVCAALEAAPRKVQQECGKHKIPVIKIGNKAWLTNENVDKLLRASEWHYTYTSEENSGTSKVRYRGATKQSAYADLQAELSNEKPSK